MKQLLLTIALFATAYFQMLGQNSIVGLIQTEANEPIHNVEVPPTFTDIYGNYLIENPVIPFIIAPYKNDDPLNGVNVCDLIDIRNHFLGINLLDSPFKIIAADVNSSNGVTTLDLVKITRVMLGIDQDFEPMRSWRFIDPNFAFPEPPNPFYTQFPEVIVINSLNGQFEADFVAVKIGDVNNSALGSYPGTGVPDTDVLFFEFANVMVVPQDEYVVDFTATDFTEANGFQFTLSYDATKMEFLEINEVNIFNGVTESISSNLVSPGKLAILWVGEEVSIPDGEVVFNAKFKIMESINLNESMMFTSDYLQIVSNNSQGCFGEIGSSPFITSTNDVMTALSTVEIFPNPTNGLFDFDLELTAPKNVSVEIYNVIGNQIFSKKYNGTLIHDQINIEKRPKGIYFLSINIDGSIITKRIVKS